MFFSACGKNFLEAGITVLWRKKLYEEQTMKGMKLVKA
jgi:hypothetical protein